MDKIQSTIRQIGMPDYEFIKACQKRLDNLTKPQGSLGRLEELAKQIVGVTGKENPEFKNTVIFTFAADHGVTEEGVSAFPKEVTLQMVYNFLNQGAGINVLAKHAGARVVVADFGVAGDLKEDSRLIIRKINYGTKNMAKVPAMSRQEAIKSIEAGIEIFEDEFKKGLDIAGTGEMGIGNTTSASAIVASITKAEVKQVTGRGTGLDDRGLENKIRIIEKSLSVNKPDAADPIDVLSKLGGFEIGGLTGVILGGCARKIPVVIDGFISGAAALLAYKLEPKTKEYMIAAHCSVERGHKVILDYIGLKPLLDLDLRLGEGTGAALAMVIVEAAVKILNEMATFQGAQVSKGNEK
ncbi:MAG: nicotinate-nucleotide--dimethylbenzimidazole phosphoribosyltransferase [Candidatus Omnitrophota bacterium]